MLPFFFRAQGKTYTILGEGDGSGEQAGLIPQCASYLFDKKKSNMWVSVSYLEVYCEEVYDLLGGHGSNNKLSLRKHADQPGFYAENLCQVQVNSAAELLAAVRRGAARRRVAATLQNERSSRSHAILTVYVHRGSGVGSTAAESGDEQQQQHGAAVLVSKLNLVDLAGSEKYNVDKGAESLNINQSLTTLSIVIQRLSQRAAFVNFRDSELTKLLESSLCGRAKTTVIACVNPTLSNRYETTSTVRFAYQAKSIPIDAKKWAEDQVIDCCE